MGGSKAPEDKSAEVAQIEAQAAAEARAAEEAQKAADLQAFNERLNSAHNNAITSASDYFTSKGLEVDPYLDDIYARANSIRGTIPSLDSSPGSYYDNLGQYVFDQAQEGERAKYLRAFDSFAPANFATKRIADTSDDAFIESILAERQAEAEQYVRNLLDRGVVTNSGYEAALKDVQGQSSGAKSRLNELGLAELETGRSGLNSIASEGRSSASNYALGSFFDPYDYQAQIDSYAGNFFAGLGDKLRGLAPADLFTTSGLAGIAGAAQGAQNLAFDPAAIAGVSEDDEEDTTGSDVSVGGSPF